MEESFLAVQCVHVSSRERVRSITISSGGGHSCRPSQHFPLYRERSHGAAPRPLTTLALAQHPATLLHWTADSPISGWKDLISSVCNYFPTYGFLSLFPLCNGGIKHWHMVTRATAKHWQWVDTVQGNNSRNAPLVFFLSYNVLLYVHYQCH